MYENRLAGDRPELAPARAPRPITSDMLAGPPARPDGRVEFERGMRYAPPLTLVLLAANVGVFAWELATGAMESRAAIVRAGALVRDRVLGGEPWRLLSATFLHGSVEHLAGNALALYVLGMACEHAGGAGVMLLVYFASALAGSAASVATGPGPSVGASGAIFGVLGAVVVLLARNRERFHVRDKRIGGVLAVWAATSLLQGWLDPVVDNAAHLGGLAAGAIIAFALGDGAVARLAGRGPHDASA